MEAEISHKKMFFSKTYRLKNMLKNSLVKEEIKEDIKSFLETNDTMKQVTKIYGRYQKQHLGENS